MRRFAPARQTSSPSQRWLMADGGPRRAASCSLHLASPSAAGDGATCLTASHASLRLHDAHVSGGGGISGGGGVDPFGPSPPMSPTHNNNVATSHSAMLLSAASSADVSRVHSPDAPGSNGEST